MTISQINPNQLRPNGDDEHGPIIRIGVERRVEAVARLLASTSQPDWDQARRFIEFARDHRINLDRLWSRLDRQGRINATVLAVANPGRTAMIFASHPSGRGQVRALAGLVDHVCDQLPLAEVNLCQVLLEPGESVEREAFRIAGFEDLAVLSYLERPLRADREVRAAQPQWPAGVAPVRYRDALLGDLLGVLARSYEDTLDCPGLRGHRSTADILEGHRASGLFDPNLWTLLRCGDDYAGALLLNPSADHQSIELVYLGLVKEARGHGLGAQLLRYGLNLVANRSESAVNLAVDEENIPAMRLYLREGFKPVLRRRAMIRPLSRDPLSATQQ